MNKNILSLLSVLFMLLCQPAYTGGDIGRQIEAKLNKAATNLMKNKDIPQSWELLVDVSFL